ncbi:lysine N(6)-hydroxylase/L-ornithine N(5)-oxygenase family protein [Streptomyces sp. A 4/2]|uniref:lysine N(6)-hydroxylase/L-ornithine N(5)-oxygenase family protein n=1 Tax=Streptomyces sp. A 4/2 TaxID=2934314 RepID=UPI0020258037|nr:SidA/IucD/PvdA family monooxygenase [Streptomyces sp. A 4/2]
MHDAIAVGCGPSNLSLAALATEISGFDLLVLERNDSMSWHPGLMVPDAALQVSPVKDLVSLVSPTNPYSFLNYLVSSGRIYRSLIASRTTVSRREFEQYYAWAAERLDSIRFGQQTWSVERAPRGFRVHAGDETHLARSLVLGVGQRPRVPSFARNHLGADVFHAVDYLRAPRRTAGRRVLVVGGGQSAAEVVRHLLGGDRSALPGCLVWAPGRLGLPPLDDSPFSNDWFTPQAVRYFHELDDKERAQLLDSQRYASDGVSAGLLDDIYRRLYELDYLEPGEFDHAILPGHRLVGLTRGTSGYQALVAGTAPGNEATLDVDTVVLATGFEPYVPSFLAPLLADLPLNDDGTFRTRLDYSLDRAGSDGGQIYVQNAARHSHGVADPNLSLSAWRSATILNALVGEPVFKTDGYASALALGPGAEGLVPEGSG